MKHLDVTIDLETLSLSPSAAIMQLGAVAWNRFEEKSECLFDQKDEISFGVDLRSVLMEGFDFSPETCKWWSERSKDLKEGILSERPSHIKEVLISFKSWIEDLCTEYKVDTICLWSQGADFDISILRNAYNKFKLEFPVSYRFIRDARSLVIEEYVRIAACSKEEAIAHVQYDYKRVYNTICEGFRKPECLQQGLSHNALFDAKQTAWSTWCALHLV